MEDPFEVRLGIAIAGAVVALVLRALWEGYRERASRRRRDREIVRLLIHELRALRGLVRENVALCEDDYRMLDETAGQRWISSPAVPLPTDHYDLLRDRPPRALVRRPQLFTAIWIAGVRATYAERLGEKLARYKEGSWRRQAEGVRARATEFHKALKMLDGEVDDVLDGLGEVEEELGRSWWRRPRRRVVTQVDADGT